MVLGFRTSYSHSLRLFSEIIDFKPTRNILSASRADERALSRTSRGGAGCDGTVAVAEALRVGADKAFVSRANVARVTCGSRGRTAQGPSNATTLAFRQITGGEVVLGVCKPLIRRVRNAGVKAARGLLLGWPVACCQECVAGRCGRFCARCSARPLKGFGRRKENDGWLRGRGEHGAMTHVCGSSLFDI
jgi:hypothetical protein